MDFPQALKIIYQKKWLIFWLTVLGAVLAFDLMVIQTPQFKASSKILVIQKQMVGQDIYSVSKSAQYLSKILREGIYSDSFLEKVIQPVYQIENSDFPEQLKERRKEWQKDLKVVIDRDLGIMEIAVFYSDKEKAEKISQAVTDVLEKNHQFYHGAGENVEVKILDQSLVSQKPVSINLWLGTILGALIGFSAGASWALRKSLKKEISSLNGSQTSV